MGGVSSERGHRASDPLHVPKLSCKRRNYIPYSLFSLHFHLRNYYYYYYLVESLSLPPPPTIESNTSTNIDGDLAPTSQHRVGQAEQQFEDDNATHRHPDNVPGRWRSKYTQLEEKQRNDHRWHSQRLLGPATVSGRSCLPA